MARTALLCDNSRREQDSRHQDQMPALSARPPETGARSASRGGLRIVSISIQGRRRGALGPAPARVVCKERQWQRHKIMKFPADGPSQYYSWRPLLTRVEELAAASTASWCIHHDADEIRKSPVPDESLKDAFVRVQAAGYNAVDHQVLQFYPTDDLYTGDPERHFQSFTLDHLDSKLHHVKAWRNTQRVNLTSSGGHIATFPGMHVYPERFVLKHYPIRGSVQGARKVLQERIARYDPAERAMNWHQQYEELVRTHQWVKKSNDILVG